MVILLTLATVRTGTPDEVRWSLWIPVGAIVALLLWAAIDDVKRVLRGEKEKPEQAPAPAGKELDWPMLAGVARRVIESTISELPPELRKEAEQVGWTWHKWSREFCASEALGQFWGANRIQQPYGDGALIVLYLGDLSEYCADYGLSFEEEVRITYLHELGHYFGWDEGEIEARGL